MHENKFDPDDLRDIQIADRLIEQAESKATRKAVREIRGCQNGTAVLFEGGFEAFFTDLHIFKTNPRTIERLGLTVVIAQHSYNQIEIFILGGPNGEGQGRSELVRYLHEVHGCQTPLDFNLGYFTGLNAPLAKL